MEKWRNAIITNLRNQYNLNQQLENFFGGITFKEKKKKGFSYILFQSSGENIANLRTCLNYINSISFDTYEFGSYSIKNNQNISPYQSRDLNQSNQLTNDIKHTYPKFNVYVLNGSPDVLPNSTFSDINNILNESCKGVGFLDENNDQVSSKIAVCLIRDTGYRPELKQWNINGEFIVIWIMQLNKVPKNIKPPFDISPLKPKKVFVIYFMDNKNYTPEIVGEIESFLIKVQYDESL